MKKAPNILAIGAGAGAIWFIGWLIYDYAQLYWQFKPQQFQNILLFTIMGQLIACACIWKAKSRPKITEQPTSFKHELQHGGPQNPADFEGFKATLDEVSDKLADVHAMMKFLKVKKEKEQKAG